MKVTYYGHSCFGVQAGGKNLLFDPFVTKNDLAQDAGIDIKKIPADYILVSHGHFDHCDDVVAIAQRTGAIVIGGFEVTQWLHEAGVPDDQVHSMNHGGAHRFDFGMVKFVSAIHSSTMPDGSPGGAPGGFVVDTIDGGFYYSGDTALTMDMQLIGSAFPNLRFAVLCIGDNYTMGYEDALHAAELVKCEHVLGVHYDTWPIIALDRAAAQEAFRLKGRTLYLPGIGESVEL